MVFFKEGSSFVTGFAINGNQSECPIVHLFCFLTVWNCLCQVFELNLKDPLISPFPASNRIESSQSFLRQKGCSVRTGRNSTYSANPVAWANHKEDWNFTWASFAFSPLQRPPRKDSGGVCLQFKSLAFCPPLFQIRRQELLQGAKGSSKFQWQFQDPKIFAAVSFICLQS